MNTKSIDKQKLPAGWKLAKISPRYWYEWGNEQRGYVSTYAYDTWGDYHFTGYFKKEDISGLEFKNPHP